MTAEKMLWEYAGDILTSPTMARERTIPQHGSTTCYDHSVAVTLCSIRLAQKWGWDVDWRSLVRGALLHDYFLYNWREHNRDHKLHGFYHARKAMENAQRDFGLNPPAYVSPEPHAAQVQGERCGDLRGQDLCHPGGLELCAERIDPALQCLDGNEISTVSTYEEHPRLSDSVLSDKRGCYRA